MKTRRKQKQEFYKNKQAFFANKKLESQQVQKNQRSTTSQQKSTKSIHKLNELKLIQSTTYNPLKKLRKTQLNTQQQFQLFWQFFSRKFNHIKREFNDQTLSIPIKNQFLNLAISTYIIEWQNLNQKNRFQLFNYQYKVTSPHLANFKTVQIYSQKDDLKDDYQWNYFKLIFSQQFKFSKKNKVYLKVQELGLGQGLGSEQGQRQRQEYEAKSIKMDKNGIVKKQKQKQKQIQNKYKKDNRSFLNFVRVNIPNNEELREKFIQNTMKNVSKTYAQWQAIKVAGQVFRLWNKEYPDLVENLQRLEKDKGKRLKNYNQKKINAAIDEIQKLFLSQQDGKQIQLQTNGKNQSNLLIAKSQNQQLQRQVAAQINLQQPQNFDKFQQNFSDKRQLQKCFLTGITIFGKNQANQTKKTADAQCQVDLNQNKLLQSPNEKKSRNSSMDQENNHDREDDSLLIAYEDFWMPYDKFYFIEIQKLKQTCPQWNQWKANEYVQELWKVKSIEKDQYVKMRQEQKMVQMMNSDEQGRIIRKKIQT